MERQLKPLPRLITKLLRQEAALTSFIHLKRHLTRWSRSLNFIEKVTASIIINHGPLSVVPAGLRGGLQPDGKPQDTSDLDGLFSSSKYDRNNQRALVQKSGEL